jgi:hypothetical protein
LWRRSQQRRMHPRHVAHVMLRVRIVRRLGDVFGGALFIAHCLVVKTDIEVRIEERFVTLRSSFGRRKNLRRLPFPCEEILDL